MPCGDMHQSVTDALVDFFGRTLVNFKKAAPYRNNDFLSIRYSCLYHLSPIPDLMTLNVLITYVQNENCILI